MHSAEDTGQTKALWIILYILFYFLFSRADLKKWGFHKQLEISQCDCDENTQKQTLFFFSELKILWV